MTVRVPSYIATLDIFIQSTGSFLVSPTQDARADAQLQSQGDPSTAGPSLRANLPAAGPSLQGNPLIIDPSLETTPPPGNPHNEFGNGTVPDYEGLDTLQPGQTLIVYHPFAGHPPEVVDTAKLALTREPDIPLPLAEPYAPFATRADFEQAEIFLRHNCTNSMINDQLRLNQNTLQPGQSGVQTMKNAHKMHRILAKAGEHWDASLVRLQLRM